MKRMVLSFKATERHVFVAHLVQCIRSVADQLPKKDFLVRVERVCPGKKSNRANLHEIASVHRLTNDQRHQLRNVGIESECFCLVLAVAAHVRMV